MKRVRRCIRCEGPTEWRKVEHPYWHGINLVALIRDVPAHVCLICGHHFFEPAVETTLGYIVKDYIKMGTIFPIPSTPYRERRSS